MKLTIMARRNFLLGLLAVTFTFIVVLQMSLDGWVLKRAVRYTVGIEKKDTLIKADVLSHGGIDSTKHNSSSGNAHQPESLLPVQLAAMKSVYPISGTFVQAESLPKVAQNLSPPQPELLASRDLLGSQRTVSNSSNAVLPGLVAINHSNVMPAQAQTVIPDNMVRQNTKSIAPSLLTELHVLTSTTRTFVRPHLNSSSPTASHVSLPISRKSSNQLHLVVPSEGKLEASPAKSDKNVPQTNNTNRNYEFQQDPQEHNKIQARIKVRSFEQPLKSRDILQRKQPMDLVSRQERLQEILKQSSSIRVRSRADPLRVIRPLPTVNPNDVNHIILVTYFRSGSTFVGDLLQQNWKTFYHFEPLHFMTYDSRIVGSNVQEAFDLFNSILRCNFSNVEKYLMWVRKPDNQFLFTRNVFLWFSCKSSRKMCFSPEMVSAVCQRAPIQVMKITRLHMRDLKKFLFENPDIKAKVVYLTRDPRGIISSRNTLDWCSDTQCSDPHILCEEMMDDLEVFNKLHREEPKRFIQVHYEELALNPDREARRLFELLGLPFTPSIQRFLRTHTTARKNDNLDPYSTRRNSSSMAFSWRSRLTFEQISSIQDTCSNVISQLNFSLITSPEELATLLGTNISADNSDAEVSNLKGLGNRTNSDLTSNLQAIGKSVEIPNHAVNSMPVDTKGPLISQGSAFKTKNIRNALDKVHSPQRNSSSSLGVLQSQTWTNNSQSANST